ncbi:carboxymuconolactone decarboxylase family protein [bacterium]|nr:carboxymuconolactone decarboxylase family protein [bacterium]
MQEEISRRGFELLDEQNAPESLREQLASLKTRMGYLPNWARGLALSPQAFEAFSALNQQVARCRMSVAEKQTIMLSISRLNDCHYCMAAHTASAVRQKLDPQLIAALRSGAGLPDERQQALRRFAEQLYEGRGKVSDVDFENFLAAGYTRQQALEVVLAIATKVLSNFADQLMEIELDPADEPYAWPD